MRDYIHYFLLFYFLLNRNSLTISNLIYLVGILTVLPIRKLSLKIKKKILNNINFLYNLFDDPYLGVLDKN